MSTVDTSVYYSASKNGFFAGAIRGSYGINWPEDCVQVTPEEHQTFTGTPPQGNKLGSDPKGKPAWVKAEAGGGLTPDQQSKQMSSWVQGMLDATARSLSYDSMAVAVSYKGDPNPMWSADADALVAYRSVVWVAALPQINAVKAGTNTIPIKSLFLASLPSYTVPTGGTQPA